MGLRTRDSWAGGPDRLGRGKPPPPPQFRGLCSGREGRGRASSSCGNPSPHQGSRRLGQQTAHMPPGHHACLSRGAAGFPLRPRPRGQLGFPSMARRCAGPGRSVAAGLRHGPGRPGPGAPCLAAGSHGQRRAEGVFEGHLSTPQCPGPRGRREQRGHLLPAAPLKSETRASRGAAQGAPAKASGTPWGPPTAAAPGEGGGGTMVRGDGCHGEGRGGAMGKGGRGRHGEGEGRGSMAQGTPAKASGTP